MYRWQSKYERFVVLLVFIFIECKVQSLNLRRPHLADTFYFRKGFIIFKIAQREDIIWDTDIKVFC